MLNNFITNEKNRLEAIEIWFSPKFWKYDRQDIFRRIGTTKKLLLTIKKKSRRFWGCKMRKGGLDNLTLTRDIKGKRSREKLSNLLDNFTPRQSWVMSERVLLRVRKDRKLLKNSDCLCPERKWHTHIMCERERNKNKSKCRFRGNKDGPFNCTWWIDAANNPRRSTRIHLNGWRGRLTENYAGDCVFDGTGQWHMHRPESFLHRAI